MRVINPSEFVRKAPPRLSSGNVYVNYYDVALETLPEEGLKSLTPYSDGYVPNIDFQLDFGGFATSGISEDVAALFSGYLDFALTDNYYICLTSDDGSKLFIENDLAISNDAMHSAEQECTTYSATAGVKHIEVEYFQRSGEATLQLQYVPLSRPDWFKLMRVINPSEFVPKPDDPADPTASPSNAPQDMDCTEFTSMKTCKNEDLCKWNKGKNECAFKPCVSLDESTCEMSDICEWKLNKKKCFTGNDACKEKSSKKACKEIKCKWKKKSKKCKAKN